MSAFDSAQRPDMYRFAGEPADGSLPTKSAGDQCHPREAHHLTPRELAWRPDPHSQSESARHWRTANEHSRKEDLQVNAEGVYKVTAADSLSTIAERSLRGQGVKPTGKAISEEMSRIADLNKDAYPDLSAHLHLVKRGMELRIKANSCSQSSTTERVLAEKSSGPARQPGIDTPPFFASLHHGHRLRDREYGGMMDSHAASGGGDQIGRTVLPLMAGLAGRLMLGGGHNFTHTDPWRRGMMENDMLGYRGRMGFGPEPGYYGGYGDGGSGYINLAPRYNNFYSRAPWYHSAGGDDRFNPWG